MVDKAAWKIIRALFLNLEIFALKQDFVINIADKSVPTINFLTSYYTVCTFRTAKSVLMFEINIVFETLATIKLKRLCFRKHHTARSIAVTTNIFHNWAMVSSRSIWDLNFHISCLSLFFSKYICFLYQFLTLIKYWQRFF